MKRFMLSFLFLSTLCFSLFAQPVIVDLGIDESYTYTRADGVEKTIKLLGLHEERDPFRQAVRGGYIEIAVDGQKKRIPVSPYALPQVVNGVKLDAPVSRGYVEKSSKSNIWQFDTAKAARLRFWDPNAPLLEPGTFAYPVEQRWFASDTQMANEPCYVNACDNTSYESIYYHYALDFGGYDLLTRVRAATDGEVISVGEEVKANVSAEAKHVIRPRYDVVYIRDERGWYYRYSHLSRILPHVKPGERVRMGEWIGLLGKEGASGGWSHLHFGVHDKNGASIEAFAFAREAYLREHPNTLLAMARPHHLAAVGEPVKLSALNSGGSGAEKLTYKWTFQDGTTSNKPVVTKKYDRPGYYSEILHVKDDRGNEDVDFAVVQVLSKDDPMNPLPPAVHVSPYPTFDIKPGQEVYFKVRTFNAQGGKEQWDFGDGASGETCSRNDYATISHHYEKPGLYIVSVTRKSANGTVATGRCKVFVGEK